MRDVKKSFSVEGQIMIIIIISEEPKNKIISFLKERSIGIQHKT